MSHLAGSGDLQRRLERVTDKVRELADEARVADEARRTAELDPSHIRFQEALLALFESLPEAARGFVAEQAQAAQAMYEDPTWPGNVSRQRFYRHLEWMAVCFAQGSYDGPLTVPEAVARFWMSQPDGTVEAMHACVECGLPVPIVPASDPGTWHEPRTRPFPSCPLCHGETHYFSGYLATAEDRRRWRERHR